MNYSIKMKFSQYAVIVGSLIFCKQTKDERVKFGIYEEFVIY